MDPSSKRSSNKNLDVLLRQLIIRAKKCMEDAKFEEFQELGEQLVKLGKDKIGDDDYEFILFYLCYSYRQTHCWEKLSSLSNDFIQRFQSAELTDDRSQRLDAVYFFRVEASIAIGLPHETSQLTTEHPISLLTNAASLLTGPMFHHTTLALFRVSVTTLCDEKAPKSEWRNLNKKLDAYINNKKQEPDIEAYFFRGHIYRLLGMGTKSEEDLIKVAELPIEKRMELETKYSAFINMTLSPSVSEVSSENPKQQDEMTHVGSSAVVTVLGESNPRTSSIVPGEIARSSKEPHSDEERSVEHLYVQALQLVGKATKTQDNKLLGEAVVLFEELIALTSNKEEWVVIYRDALSLLCTAYHALERWSELYSLAGELIRFYQSAEGGQDLLSRNKLAQGYFYKAKSILSSCSRAEKLQPWIYTAIQDLLKKTMHFASEEELLHRSSLTFFTFFIQRICYTKAEPAEWNSLQKEIDCYLDTHASSLAEKPQEIRNFILAAYFWRACIYGLLGEQAKVEADLTVGQQLPAEDLEELVAGFPALTNQPLPAMVAAFLSNQHGKHGKPNLERSSTALAMTGLARMQQREKLLIDEMKKAKKSLEGECFVEAQISLKQVMGIVLRNRAMSEKELDVLRKTEEERAQGDSKKNAVGKISKRARSAAQVREVAQRLAAEQVRRFAGKLLEQVVIFTRRKAFKKVSHVLEGLSQWDAAMLGSSNYKNMTKIRCSFYFTDFKKRGWKGDSDWSQGLSELSGIVKSFMEFWSLVENQSLDTQQEFSGVFLSLVESVLDYATEEQRAVLLDSTSEEHSIIVKLLKATRALSSPVEKVVTPTKKEGTLSPDQTTQNYTLYRLGKIHASAEEIFRTFDPEAFNAEQMVASSPTLTRGEAGCRH